MTPIFKNSQKLFWKHYQTSSSFICACVMQKCNHAEIYKEISDENLELMRERLMETVKWPSDDTNTEKIGWKFGNCRGLDFSCLVFSAALILSLGIEAVRKTLIYIICHPTNKKCLIILWTMYIWIYTIPLNIAGSANFNCSDFHDDWNVVWMAGMWRFR